MRKAIRLFVVLCIVALAATVYQPTKAQSLPEVLKLPDQIAGGRPVTFTITNMPPETDTAARKAWDELVGRFQAKYPNVTVQGLEYTYGADSFAALVAGDQVPTLFQVYMTEPQKYIESGVAGDITSLLDASGLTSVFNSDLLNLASKDGKYYAIPYNAYAMGLGYNISLLKAAGYDAPPATWDELREMAKKLTNRDNGVVGFSFINDGGPATGWHFTVLAYTYGATPGGIIHLADGKYSA
ncbi:MAG: extracellular solute-binding protein, partial [Anaerolineae bacterium]|nr:extracellular solute-binding protein [Anaerolineae bacterium]